MEGIHILDSLTYIASQAGKKMEILDDMEDEAE